MAARKTKIKKIVLKDENKLETKSVICAICRTIFVEPVTLPCNHTFCKECFETSMKNTILSCPSCRLRVSSWFRRSEKANSIVNQEFWKYIQHQYSTELRNKQNKITNLIGECKPIINPTEFRTYEKEKRKTLEEHRKVQEAEEGASFSLFNKNLTMAKKETNKHFNAGKILKNPRLTKTSLTHQDYNNLPSTSSKNIKKSSIYSKFGTMDRFIQVDSVDYAGHSQKQAYVSKLNKKKLNSDLNNKKYLCHDVTRAEKNPPQITTINLMNNFERDHRKACTSGYKSTGSGDVIDQEINHYFKPISVPKGCHFSLTPPLRVVPLVGIVRESVFVQSPSGPFSLNENRDASAFIKLYPQIEELTNGKNVNVPDISENENASKRKLSSSTSSEILKKKLRIEDADLIAINNVESEFCGFHNCQQTSVENIKDLYKNCVTILEHGVVSKESKFCGFHNSQRESVKDARSTLKKCIKNMENNLEIQCNATIFCDINKVDVNRNIPVNVDIKAIAEEWIDEKFMDKTPLQNVQNYHLDEQIGNSTIIIKEISQLSQASTTSNKIYPEKSSAELCNNNILLPKKLSGKFKDEEMKKSKEKSLKISNTSDVQINAVTPIIKRITRSNAQKLLEANKNRFQDIDSLKIIHQSREDETLVESEDPNDLIKKKSQEKEDFEYAKKLQAQFDRIQRVSRTRRTNKRQITLDKILIT